MTVTATYALELQLSGSAGAWTDVWPDVRFDAPLRGQYGIRGAGPTDRVAGVGTLNFALDNSEKNSAGLVGYYSPGHANARAGFEIGIHVRLGVTYSGSTFYKFRGTVDELVPQPGAHNRRLTVCTAVDWMDETRREKTRLIATQLDKRGNELIATMVGNMTRKPAASALATGQDIFPFAFDNSPDEHTSVMQMLQLIAQAELGFIYLAGDTATGGVLTFQDRHARPKAGSAVASLNDDMVSMTPRRSRDTVYNHIKATVHPRRTDSSACVLFTLRDTPLVRAGANLTFMSAYLDRTAASNPLASRIGAFTACNLVQSTDYLFNSASNGGGADLSANLTVGASFGANSHRISLANTGATDGYVTRLQIRGRGLYDYEPVELESIDTDSTACFGDNVLTYDMKLQNDTAIGRDVADYLLAVWKDPLTRIDAVQFVAHRSDALMLAGLQGEPSTRINLVETVSGINRDFYINGVGFELANRNVLKFTWQVVPTDPFAAWLVGVAGSSEIGQTTIVGY